MSQLSLSKMFDKLTAHKRSCTAPDRKLLQATIVVRKTATQIRVVATDGMTILEEVVSSYAETALIDMTKTEIAAVVRSRGYTIVSLSTLA
jgi:hypothetical protein